jgi:hypothetical protein
MVSKSSLYSGLRVENMCKDSMKHMKIYLSFFALCRGVLYWHAIGDLGTCTLKQNVYPLVLQKWMGITMFLNCVDC